MCRCLQTPEASDPRETECRQLGVADVGAGNWAWVFSKNSRSSQLLGHISSPLIARFICLFVLFLGQSSVLEPRILLLQPPECCDYTQMPSHSGQIMSY